MPQTNIDHAVQRCRELAEEIEEARNDHDIEQGLVTSGYHAKDLLPHLSLVLAELKRLREAEWERREAKKEGAPDA